MPFGDSELTRLSRSDRLAILWCLGFWIGCKAGPADLGADDDDDDEATSSATESTSADPGDTGSDSDTSDTTEPPEEEASPSVAPPEV